jgi:hypothetical protein
MYSIGPLSGPWPCGLGLAQRHKRPNRPWSPCDAHTRDGAVTRSRWWLEPEFVFTCSTAATRGRRRARLGGSALTDEG